MMSATSGEAVTYDDVKRARARLDHIVHHTPTLRSRLLDERSGAQLHLKLENLQRTGSFKVRGAYNNIASLAYSAAGVHVRLDAADLTEDGLVLRPLLERDLS